MFLWKFGRVFGEVRKSFFEVRESGQMAGGCLGAAARVPDVRGGGIPAAGKLLSLLMEEFRVLDIFSPGGRNATAPTQLSRR